MILSEKLFPYGKSITETELQKTSRQGDYLLFHHEVEEMDADMIIAGCSYFEDAPGFLITL